MQSYFRLLAVILISSFLTGITVLADSADSITVGADNANYADAITVITALDLMQNADSGDFGSENSVTRAEFAQIVAKLLNLPDDDISENGNHFKDVEQDDPSANYINSVAALGYMTGDSDGNFRPDEFVDYSQAVKIIVSVLGYDLVAKASGGYPTGYIATAAKIGLLDKINLKPADEIKKGCMAQLIYNSTQIDIMVNDQFGKSLVYSTKKGRTLLTEYHHIWRDTGVLKANEYSSITSADNNVGKGKVIIEDTLYNEGNTSASQYLGYKTEFYYLQESPSSDRVLKYIRPYKYCSVLNIDADNISSFNDRQYKYYDNQYYQGKDLKEAKLSDTADVIFNKKAYVSADTSVYIPQSGNVTLVDNTGDGIYDVVIISSYKTYFVDSVNRESKVITDKYVQTRLKLDTKKQYKIIQDGEEIDIGSISTGSLLMVYADKEKPLCNSAGQQITVNDRAAYVIDDDNSSLYIIYVIDNKLSGKVSEVDNTSYTATIDNVVYKISPDYLAAVQLNSSDAVNIEAGSEGDFYLDSNKRICAAKLPHLSGGQYGFLINLANSRGVDGKIQIKVLDSSSNVSIYTLADNVKLNGVAVPQNSIIENSALYDKANKAVKPQLIYYGLDSAGDVYKIDTAQVIPSGGKLADYQNCFSLDAQYRGDSAKAYYGNNMLATRYILTESTKVFVIPGKNVDGKIVPDTSATDDDYFVTGRSYFAVDNEYKNLDIYDVSNNLISSAVVVWNLSGVGSVEISVDPPITIVDKVTTVVDSNGENKYKIVGFQGDNKVELITKSADLKVMPEALAPNSVWGNLGVYARDLKQGDIIQYSTDTAGEMNGFRLLVRNTATATQGLEGRNQGAAADPNHTYAVSYVGFGQIKDVYSNVAYVDTRNGTPDTYRVFVAEDKTIIYLFDTQSKTIKKADYSEMQVGDYLVGQSRYGAMRVMLIVRRPAQ